MVSDSLQTRKSEEVGLRAGCRADPLLCICQEVQDCTVLTFANLVTERYNVLCRYIDRYHVHTYLASRYPSMYPIH